MKAARLLSPCIATLLAAASAGAFAQPTPVGLWKTIDDETKQEKSLLRITESAGVLTAKVERLLDPARQGAVCLKCSDERRDQPIVGMTIVHNVKQNAADKGTWDGGEILDPNDGRTYRVRMKPVDGGKALEVRGYIGVPQFGRTQTWFRVE